MQHIHDKIHDYINEHIIRHMLGFANFLIHIAIVANNVNNNMVIMIVTAFIQT